MLKHQKLTKVVQDFFNSVSLIPDGSYTKDQMKKLLGYPLQSSSYDEWHFSVVQSQVDSGSSDYAVRSFICNGSGFFISDQAKFVVQDGIGYIENMSVIPEPDNFDFDGTDPFTNIANKKGVRSRHSDTKLN